MSASIPKPAAKPFATSTATTIPGITLHATPQALHVHSQTLLSTLSSSFYGGGFGRVRHILNAYVSADYAGLRPAEDLRAIATRCGVHAPFIGLLTAVPLHRARLVQLQEGEMRVAVLATAGVGNATSAGVSPPFQCGPGTINLIVLLHARLSHAAMVNAVITATEAKSAVLQALEVRTPEGAMATGTSTDTVTIAMTAQGPRQPYAGPATVPGWLIGRAVRQAVQESLQAA